MRNNNKNQQQQQQQQQRHTWVQHGRLNNPSILILHSFIVNVFEAGASSNFFFSQQESFFFVDSQ